MLGLPNYLDKIMKTLAERLRHAMEVLPPKKIKGVDLARAVGVKPPSVSDWLSGKSKTMEGENLLKAAKYLGVSPIWLATGKGEHELEFKNSDIQDHNLTISEKNYCLYNLFELNKKIEKLALNGDITKDQLDIVDGMLSSINATIDTWVQLKKQNN